jgi:hypothetical protein
LGIVVVEIMIAEASGRTARGSSAASQTGPLHVLYYTRRSEHFADAGMMATCVSANLARLFNRAGLGAGFVLHLPGPHATRTRRIVGGFGGKLCRLLQLRRM